MRMLHYIHDVIRSRGVIGHGYVSCLIFHDVITDIITPGSTIRVDLWINYTVDRYVKRSSKNSKKSSILKTMTSPL